MRTTKSLFLTLFVLLVGAYTYAQTATTTLMTEVTTAHNFYNGEGGYTFAVQPGEGVCNVCHTPHNSTSIQLPLWDHNAANSGSFQLYASGTLDGSTAGIATSASMLCLGCHDGTANLDSYGGTTGTVAWTTPADDYANFGTDLRNDHPIGITYVETAGTQMVPSGNSAGLSQPGTIADLMLTGGTTVDCTSCHSLHNPAATEIGSLLRKSNTASALCLTCHAK